MSDEPLDPAVDLISALRAGQNSSAVEDLLKRRVQSRLAVSLIGLTPTLSGTAPASNVAKAISGNSIAAARGIGISKGLIIASLAPVFALGVFTGMQYERAHVQQSAYLANPPIESVRASASVFRVGTPNDNGKNDAITSPESLELVPAARASSASSVGTPDAASSLAAERHLLDEARQALARGEPQTGMKPLGLHAKRFPRGVLTEEREALAVRLLAALGNQTAAIERAQRFHARFPNSLFIPAVDNAVAPFSKRHGDGEPNVLLPPVRHVAGASLLASLCMTFIAGCSAKTVDLGVNGAGSDPVYSNTVSVPLPDSGSNLPQVPTHIVDHGQNGCGYGQLMNMYTVDAGTLYWVWPDNDTSVTLRRCAVEHCADSVVKLTTVAAAGMACQLPVPKNSTQSDGDEIYWINPVINNVSSQVLMAASKTVASSSSIVWSRYDWGQSYLVSEGILYATTAQNTLIQCQASDCASTQARYDLVPPDDHSMNALSIIGLDEEYIYLSVATGTPPTRLLRVAKSPHAPVEVVLSMWPTSASDFVVQGDSVYWVEAVSLGQLLSCPKTGCANNKPTVLMSGLETPTGLAADDDNLYVLEPPVPFDSRPGRILKCPQSGCSEPTVLYTSTNEVSMGQLRVDDRFVYFAGTDCAEGTVWASPCGFIAAIPK
jgi:hypothetical protein